MLPPPTSPPIPSSDTKAEWGGGKVPLLPTRKRDDDQQDWLLFLPPLP